MGWSIYTYLKTLQNKGKKMYMKLTEETKIIYAIKDHMESWLGMVAHAYNHSTSGSQDRWITR